MTKHLLLAVLLLVGLSASAQKARKMLDNYDFRRGMEILSQDDGDPQEAFNSFEKEVAAHPQNGYAYYMMGVIFYNHAQYSDALTKMDTAIGLLQKAKDPERLSWAYEKCGEIYRDIGEKTKALDYFAKALKTDPNNTDVLVSRFNMYVTDSLYDLARADADKLVSRLPAGTEGYEGRGILAMAAKQYDKAADHFSYCIKLDAAEPRFYTLRAECYQHLDRNAEATDDVIQSLLKGFNGPAVTLATTFRGDALEMMLAKTRIQQTKAPNESFWPYLIGQLYFSDKQYDEAVKAYRQAYDLEADAVLAYHIAKGCHEANRTDEALQSIDKAISLDTTDIDYPVFKGELLAYSGRYDEAEAAFTKAITIEPENPGLYLFRGILRQKSGKAAEAIEDLSTNISLCPPGETVQPISYYYRGVAYKDAGQNDKAEADLRQAVGDSSPEKPGDGYAAYALVALGEKDRALAIMKALTDSVRDMHTLYNAACLYALAGAEDQAVACLKESVDSGFHNRAQLTNDEDLVSIRKHPDFKAILERLTPSDAGVPDSGSPAGKATGKVSYVPFTRQDGVTYVKCAINGLPLSFVFDTGASDVTISMVEATFMMKNGYLNQRDVMGSQLYMDANGNVSEGTKLMLRKVTFGDLELDNIRASVVRNQRAPLLLGQSVLARLGSVTIDNSNDRLVIRH